MWKITYEIEHGYYDDDNRRAYRNDGVYTVYGETKDRAVENLFKRLDESRDLKPIISTSVDPDQEYTSHINIVSFDLIKESISFDFYEHPLFVNAVIDARIEEEKRVRSMNEACQKRKESQELETLRNLLEKYPHMKG